MIRPIAPDLAPGPRIFAVSDLHVDFKANMRWLHALPRDEHRDDVLLVAGDVSHDLAQLEEALASLRTRFARLAFVPGNHELWLKGSDAPDSLQKFQRILELCARIGVDTAPFRSVDAHGNAAWVVPLFSWYVMPEEGEDGLFLPKPGEDPSLRAWADRFLVKWPATPEFGRAADHFLALNEARVQRDYDAPVVSFSHFLPRAELMRRTAAERAALGPGPADEHPWFNFSRVAGAQRLDEQIRRLGAAVHVYGHQHRNRWRPIDGVLYVSNCLGYPNRKGELHANDRALWQIWGHAPAAKRVAASR